MLYDGYLKAVADKFDKHFSDIAAYHNFELGNEFEVALCQVLRRILPDRFGVCRGFIVTRDGKRAGDDIIIFNREHFGTLRLLDQNDFSRLEAIPVETVCAYIEAKHTVSLEGDGGQSLNKALSQVAAVKALPRRKISYNEISPGMGLHPDDYQIRVPKGWPDDRNPMFTCVWSRQVRLKEKDNILDDPQAISNALSQLHPQSNPTLCPDLIALGPKTIVLPLFQDAGGRGYVSPFFIPTNSTYTVQVTDVGFAIGICSILYALERIQTDSLSWQQLIADGLGK